MRRDRSLDRGFAHQDSISFTNDPCLSRVNLWHYQTEYEIDRQVRILSFIFLFSSTSLRRARRRWVQRIWKSYRMPDLYAHWFAILSLLTSPLDRASCKERVIIIPVSFRSSSIRRARPVGERWRQGKWVTRRSYVIPRPSSSRVPTRGEGPDDGDDKERMIRAAIHFLFHSVGVESHDAKRYVGTSMLDEDKVRLDGSDSTEVSIFSETHVTNRFCHYIFHSSSSVLTLRLVPQSIT